MKSAIGEKDYSKLLDNIMDFSTEYRFRQQGNCGRNDMEVDALSQKPQRASDNAEKAMADIDANVAGYGEQEWVDHLQQLSNDLAEQLDYMGNQRQKGNKGGKAAGKGAYKGGNGLGKGGARALPAARAGAGAAAVKDTRVCHWCRTVGHMIRKL